jgi:hypothetical protein
MSTPVGHGENDGMDQAPVYGDRHPPTGPGPSPDEPPRRRRAAIRRQTSALLSGLGGDVDTVVEHLGRAGVRGSPTNAEHCAVAMYLQAVMTGDPRVGSVSVGNTSVMVSPPQVWRRSVAVSLPGPVRRFVEAFDERHYPQLELSDSAVPTA